VRTEIVEVHVPVRPDIPAEILAECRVDRTRPANPTVDDLALLAEEQRIALEKCSKEKRAIRAAVESIPAPPG
jgi:hypothetical protein